MNKLLVTLLMAPWLCSLGLAQWREGTLPEPKQWGYAASSDTHLFYCGGGNAFFPVSKIEAYEFSTSTWTTHPTAEIRSFPAAVFSHGKLYVAGGDFYQGGVLSYHDSVEVLDPESGIISQLTLPIPVARADAAAVGDYVFFAGGRNGPPLPGTIQAYHIPTDSWELISMQTQDRRFMGVASDDRWVAFVGGGFPNTDGPWVLNLFDNLTETWEVVPMPNHHMNCGAAILDGKLYVKGTNPPYGNPDVVDVFDLNTREWTEIPSASHAYRQYTFAMGPYVVFANGYLGDHLQTAEIWNTLTGEWRTTELSVAAQVRASASSEEAGIAAIFGGQDPTIGNATDKIDYFVVDQDLGEKTCFPAEINSTGQPGTLSAVGASVAEDNFVTLLAEGLPAGPFAFGLFLVSDQPGFLPSAFGSHGTLCLGPFARLHATLQPVDSEGRLASSPDLHSLPAPFSQAVAAGQSWYFQAWYRDSLPGTGATTNFTNALRLDFQ